MATSAEIQKFVQRHHGFIPKTGWIAHVKEVHGVPTVRGAKRARRDRHLEPCPPDKREAIEEALRHFGVILPFTPLASTLGFVPLPGAYFVFLGGATTTYLILVELVKRRLMRRLLGMGPASPVATSVTPAS